MNISLLLTYANLGWLHVACSRIPASYQFSQVFNQRVITVKGTQSIFLCFVTWFATYNTAVGYATAELEILDSIHRSDHMFV